MASEDWIFPIGEGVPVGDENGRWSDGAFFDEEDIPIEWHQAEPASHVQDREVWKRWLEFLETSPSAAQTLLTVAKTRARANAAPDLIRAKPKAPPGTLAGTGTIKSGALRNHMSPS